MTWNFNDLFKSVTGPVFEVAHPLDFFGKPYEQGQRVSKDKHCLWAYHDDKTKFSGRVDSNGRYIVQKALHPTPVK